MADTQTHISIVTHGRPYVEIGGVKWATMNIGAKSPKELGLYFAFGDTKGHTREEIENDLYCFEKENYKFHDNQKYHEGGMTELDLCDDAAHVLWRGYWRMPTDIEYLTLFDHCICSVEGGDGLESIGCFRCTDKQTGKELYFPLGGQAEQNRILNLNGNSSYWGKTIGLGKKYLPKYVNNSIPFNTRYLLNNIELYHGLQIRPVLDETLSVKKLN